MNIAKGIKIYFYFVLILLAMASASNSPVFKPYYASISHSFNQVAEDISALEKIEVSVYKADELMQTKRDRNFFVNRSLDGVFNFEINRENVAGFARVGEADAAFMNFRIKTAEAPLKIHKIKVSLKGGPVSSVRNVALMQGDEYLAFAERTGDFFVFSGLNFTVEAESEKNLLLVADLGLDLKVNDRLRFDIEAPEDIHIEFKGSQVGLAGNYPLKGINISIVGGKNERIADN